MTNKSKAVVASEASKYTENIANFLIKNLLPVTIGNIVGGAFCLGAPMYYLNREKKKD
jgi:formate transporter